MTFSDKFKSNILRDFDRRLQTELQMEHRSKLSCLDRAYLLKTGKETYQQPHGARKVVKV